ncbi:MAG: methyltransferase domain-containing protein [bacterium]|nr:methyltransferase domain-containing protein [bacterium]
MPVWSAHFAQPLLAAFRRDRVTGRVGAGARVLDAGCGVGYPAAELAARYPDLRLEALELWPPALARARARGLNARRGDLLGWQAPPYDAVVANVCINTIDDRTAAAAALARLLRGGGRLYVTTTLRGTLRALDRAAERICRVRGVVERMQEHRFTAFALRQAFSGGAFGELAIEIGRFALRYESGTAMTQSPPIRIAYEPRYRRLLGDDGWTRLVDVLDREGGITLEVPFALLTATRLA